MADNVGYTPGTGATVAADDIAGVLYQRVKIGVGADGTAVDLSSANPMPIATPSGAIDVTVGNFPASQAVTGPLTDAQLRASAVSSVLSDPATPTTFGPITAASTVLFAEVDTSNERSIVLQLSGLWDGGVYLQQSNDGTTWWAAQGTAQNNDVTLIDTIYNPDVVVVQLSARYFRAITTPDFTGTISGSYVLRASEAPQTMQNVQLMSLDPSVFVPIAALDQANNLTRIRANNFGQLILADNVQVVAGRSGLGPIFMVDTTGYNSIVFQLTGTWAGTVTFQVSNDGATWSSAVAWIVSGAQIPVSSATANGQWIIPTSGRFFRAQVTAWTSGLVSAHSVLRNAPAYIPANIPSQNIAQIGGTAVVTGGVAGVQAIGGNIAVGAAPTANPVPIGGWDGTNTRRILTDAVSGGVALGAAGVSNGATVSTLISAATNNLTQLKATIGKVFIIDIQNTVASIRYLKLFNLPSASVTMGTTSATLNFSIPASGKLSIVTDLGINLGGTGVTYALTGGSSLTDNTQIGAGDLIANFMYV